MMQMNRNMSEYLRYIKYCYCTCCVFVGMDNKLHKLHGTYIKIKTKTQHYSSSLPLTYKNVYQLTCTRYKAPDVSGVYRLL